MAAVSEQGKIISEEVRTYGSVKKGFTFFRKGDVLLAKITPCFENGKSAKTDDMKHSVGFGSTEFHVLRASESLHPSYLFSILHDKRFRNKAEENMTGSAGQKRVPSTYLKEYVIPLPPMGLQKEFASRIEAIDGLVAQNEDMLTIHEKLFTSLQHRAFAGEL
jgi:type I restriction enzyme S subunit